MSFKQTAVALVALIILAMGFGFWASKTPGSPIQQQHVLKGEMIGEGEYQYTEDMPYYKITAAYPAGRLSVEQALADRISQFKSDSGLETLTAEDIRIQGLGPDRKYALDMQYKAYSSAGRTSYLYTVYADTLGAHPNTYYLTFVFDQNGKQVSLGDLFPNNPNWLEELSLLVSNDVTAQLRQRTGLADVSGSVFAEGLAPKVENFSNFVIDGDNLLIEIPPYQVAAYAAGAFEVKIPLKNLQ